MYAAAARYSGTFDADGRGYGGPAALVRFWEVWNEPNYIGALRPQRPAGKPASPRMYTSMLNTRSPSLPRRAREKLTCTCSAAP